MLNKQFKKKCIRRSVSDVSSGRFVWKNVASVVSNWKAGYGNYYNQTPTHEISRQDKLRRRSQPCRDLIQLKSPTSPNAPNSKLPGNESCRRKSVEVAEITNQGNRIERIGTINLADRFSTVLTPTATSFSKDELNEIFNITRHDMDIEKSPNKEKILKESINDSSFQSDHESTLHNVALDQSSISLDSTLVDSPSPAGIDFADSTEIRLVDTETPIKDSPRPVLQPLNLQNTIEIPVKNNFENGEVMNLRSPFTPSPDGRSTFTPIQMVCREIFMTERSYVNDLQEVIEGYIYHLKQQTDLDYESIFGNLEAIYEFNKDVLYQLEQCETDDNEINPIQLAKVFSEKATGFNHHYTQYCTNYPEVSSFFAILMQDARIAHFFVERQKVIGHALPLESYLLKPVQRIMKYHLLFRDILKRYEGDEQGYNDINTAVLAMTDVAEYINEMKRLHENAVKVQQILSKIVDLDVPIDVFETGRLVLENTFKIHGVRTERIMYLFEKLLLICKKTEDKLYQFKEKIECSNMMLVESLGKDPLAFQIRRFDNQKVNYTIVAKNLDIKKEWTQHLKRLILENHAAKIPQTARQAILGPEEQAKSKYNSLPIDALDDSVMDNLRNLTKAGPKCPLGKENVAQAAGVKRESNEKESSNAPKRSLNAKAKEYLLDKRSRGSLLPAISTTNTSPDKEKKFQELLRWKKGKHKHKPSLDGSIILGPSPEESPPDCSKVKSRSLESLKDSMKQPEPTSIESNSESNILKDKTNLDYEKLNEEQQPVKTGKRSRPTSMIEAEGITDSLLSSNKQTTKTFKEIKDPSGTRNECSGKKVAKSMSMTYQRNLDVNEDTSKRWSYISDSDPMQRLERQLSILSDDDTSATSIKNMVRKVSNAFNSSFQAYDDSPRSAAVNEMDISRDLGIILGTSPKTSNKSVYRRSIGGLGSLKVSASPSLGRSRSELSVFNEKPSLQKVDINVETKCEVNSTSSEPVDMILYVSQQNRQNEPDENRWSADVDQVFNEVNADLDSIADSIGSDPAKSNESESDSAAGVETVTSVGVEINHRAAIVDQRLKEANQHSTSPDSARKINVEVKSIADRIKEYKKLIDSEKQRNSWRRRGPRTMNEMIESLDSINSTNNGSPVYSSYRRRFKSSRDLGNATDSRTSIDSDVSTSSVKRSFSESFNSETSSLSPKLQSKQYTGNLMSFSESRLSDSNGSLSSTDLRTLKETEPISKRTEKYYKALHSIEFKIKPVTSQRSVSASSPHIVRKENDDNVDDNVDDNGKGQDVFDLEDKENQLSPIDWKVKSDSLPRPRRANAIKRSTRRMSGDLLDQRDKNKPNYPSSATLPARLQGFDEDDDTYELRSKNNNKNALSIYSRPPRSSSVPPEKRHSTSDTVIHEEVSSQYVHPRLSLRPMSDSSASSQEERSRGRSENVKDNMNSMADKYCSLPRPRKKNMVKTEGPLPSNHRSVSLPRRSNLLQPPTYVDGLKTELDENENSILRSPSIRCIQQNHVNNRIKDYFTNLQRSSQISRSRPNLLLVGGSDGSDSDNESSSNDDGRTSPTSVNGNSSNNTSHILRGTVRSMINRYGQSNYVFDS